MSLFVPYIIVKILASFHHLSTSQHSIRFPSGSMIQTNWPYSYVAEQLLSFLPRVVKLNRMLELVRISSVKFDPQGESSML